MKHRLLILALIVSAAFNVGFLGALGYHSCSSTDSAMPRCVPHAEPSGRLAELSARLQRQLEPLRAQQADETRRLAGLISAPEPDRAAIEASLDRLATIGRSIHGLVVNTVLEQTELMPDDERAVFCSHVHRRLCDPWVGCGTTACDAAGRKHQPQHRANEPQGGTPQ